MVKTIINAESHGFSKDHEIMFRYVPIRPVEDNHLIRQFPTGANRNSDEGKFDYEGFLSPQVLQAYGAYMHVNRHLMDGTYRDSDNWQKGIPVSVYIKSGWRHFFDLWKTHRGQEIDEGELGAAMGVLFNVMGWVHERIKVDPEWYNRELKKFEKYRAKELEARKSV